jgi:PDDEXK-like uncharacterized protein DUF3799
MAELLNIAPADYHQRPELSSSIAKTIIAKSELHAWNQHPAYGGNGIVPTKEMDRGSAVGRFLLGKGADLACLPFDDWKTKAAQETRDKTRAAGVIPLTHVQYTEYETAAREIKKRLCDMGHFISEVTGVSEPVILWDENSPYGPVGCRCMMDHLSIQRATIYELKCPADAHPDHVERSSESMGYRIGAAAYIRALAALRPDLVGSITFQFLFCEPTPPYAIYAPQPSAEFIESGDRDWTSAVARWARAKRDNYWPGYESAGSITRPKWAMRKEGCTAND